MTERQTAFWWRKSYHVSFKQTRRSRYFQFSKKISTIRQLDRTCRLPTTQQHFVNVFCNQRTGLRMNEWQQPRRGLNFSLWFQHWTWKHENKRKVIRIRAFVDRTKALIHNCARLRRLIIDPSALGRKTHHGNILSKLCWFFLFLRSVCLGVRNDSRLQFRMKQFKRSRD